MSDGDEPANVDHATAYPGRKHLPPISLRLHEAVGLCLLFHNAPPSLVQGLQIEDEQNGKVSYAFSAAYGYMRIREAVARLYRDQDTLLSIAAERAALDQIKENWTAAE